MGVHDYGILRAWGGNAFWNFRRQGGDKTWKPSVVGYGYFLELPNYAISFRDYEKETVNYDLDKDDNKGKKINEQKNLLSTIVLKNDNYGRKT